MSALKKLLLEVSVVLGLGVLLGFSVNAVRGHNSIKLTRDYFLTTSVLVSAKPEQTTGPPTPYADHPATDDSRRPWQVVTPPTHEFQVLDFERTRELFEDPTTKTGVYLFVDSRRDAAFAQCHIPGSMQCDRYRLREYIVPVLEAIERAKKVVVYCDGGKCEDSILLCRELIAAEVAHKKLYLYPGGCAEWVARGMPCEQGKD